MNTLEYLSEGALPEQALYPEVGSFYIHFLLCKNMYLFPGHGYGIILVSNQVSFHVVKPIIGSRFGRLSQTFPSWKRSQRRAAGL
mmetsp:Transcript_72526/g.203618  ORF Transcript_72526/g.203618 Transcript_72526/m.203618 type:complete len:85 (+) Transcript_72526:1553-1807(+)